MAMNESNIMQNSLDRQAETGFQKPLRLGIVYQEESGRGLTHPFFVLILDAFKQRAEEMGCEVTFINRRCMSGLRGLRCSPGEGAR